MQRGSRSGGGGGSAAGGGQRRTLPLALLIVTVLAAGVLVLSVAVLKNSSPATVPGLRGIGRVSQRPATAGLQAPEVPRPTKAQDRKAIKSSEHPPAPSTAKGVTSADKSDASRSEDAPQPQAPATGGVGDFKTEPVKHAADLADGGFYLFQDAESGQYLSRALDTNVVDSFPREKVFRLHKSGEYKGWAIKGHTRLHLAVESTNKLTVDRPWARTHEQFTFADAKKKDSPPSTEGRLILIRSRKNNMYLSHATSTEGALVADEGKATVAIKWRVLRVTSCDSEESCWGKETMFGAPPGPKDHRVRSDADADDAQRRFKVDPLRAKWEQKAMQRMAAFGPFPIVGSPKPLSSTAPLKPGDPWDPVLISKRTMKNWASIPGLVELQFTDDRNTLKIIEELNRNVSASRKTADGKYVACATPLGRIRSDEKYEAEPKFNNQPTYRGLFQRGLELFPKARGVMFSNGDILYTPSLTQTIERVLRFLDDKKAALEAQGKPWHDRWMIVGQRINHEVPADWDLDDARDTAAGDPEAAACDHGFPRWVRDIEAHAKQGRIFQSDAEDYFIVSRKMFDWAKIPDFIVGGVAFDNWITSKAARLALKGEAVLIDASKTVTALHQNHGHNIKSSHDTPKSQYNSHLAAHNGGIGGLGHTADAPVATERRSDGSITVYDKHRLMFG